MEALRELMASLGFEVDEAGFKSAEKRIADVLRALREVDAAAKKTASSVSSASGKGASSSTAGASALASQIANAQKAMSGPVKDLVKSLGTAEHQIGGGLEEFVKGIVDGAKQAAKELSAAKAQEAAKPDKNALLNRVFRGSSGKAEQFVDHDAVLRESKRIRQNPLFQKMFGREAVRDTDSPAVAMAKQAWQQGRTDKRTRQAQRSGGVVSRPAANKMDWGDWMELSNGLNHAAAQTRSFFEYAVHQSMELESALAKVSSKMDGISTQDLAKMKAAAQQMGMQFGYTSAQAAEGLEALGASGLSADEAIKSLSPSLQFARASELGVNRATEVVMETMHQFGLQTKDFTMIGDVLVKAANASTISVADMAESLKYVGPNAHAAGVSLETTAVMVAALGNAGIKGSMAGTTLRGMFNALTKQSAGAGKALAKVGLSAKDMKKGVTDPIGLLTELAKRMEGLDEATRGEVLTKVFGTEASAGITAFIDKINQNAKEGKQGFGDLAAQIHNYNGAMKQTSDVLNNTTQARFERLKNTMATTAAILGDTLLPTLERVTDVTSELVREYQRWADENPKLNDGLTKAGLALVALTTAGGAASSVFRTLRPLAKLFGLLGGGAVVGGIGSTAAGAGTAAATVGAVEAATAGTAAVAGTVAAGTAAAGTAGAVGGAAAAGGLGASLMAATGVISAVAAVVLAAYGLKRGTEWLSGEKSDDGGGLLDQLFGDQPFDWNKLWKHWQAGQEADMGPIAALLKGQTSAQADGANGAENSGQSLWSQLFGDSEDHHQRLGERNDAFRARLERWLPQEEGESAAAYQGRIGREAEYYQLPGYDEAKEDEENASIHDIRHMYALLGKSHSYDLTSASLNAPKVDGLSPTSVSSVQLSDPMAFGPRAHALETPLSWNQNNAFIPRLTAPSVNVPVPGASGPSGLITGASEPPTEQPRAGQVDSHDTVQITIHSGMSATELNRQMNDFFNSRERSKQQRTQTNLLGR